MTLQQLQAFPKDRVRALFGLEPAALSQLLTTMLPELVARRLAEQNAKPGRKRSPGGGRRRKLYPYQEVLLLRDLCPAHRFDAEKKWTKKEPSWRPETLDVVLVDSFETSIARPSLPDAQKQLYSGKKKRHTIKTQIITDKHGEVLALEPGYPGPLPDKTLYEQSAASRQYPQAARRGDLAYQGVPEMLLPNKRKRGKAGEKAKDKEARELTPEQKAENQHQASQRVYVEHGVRRCKAWRILRDELRLGRGLFPLVALATVGLVHLARLCPGQ